MQKYFSCHFLLDKRTVTRLTLTHVLFQELTQVYNFDFKGNTYACILLFLACFDINML
jgi:hypothetical protein